MGYESEEVELPDLPPPPKKTKKLGSEKEFPNGVEYQSPLE
jgi:hypothetical protein